MNKLCKRCGLKNVEGAKNFCSDFCRKAYLSEMMIKRSVEIKKKFGNSYYLPKDTNVKVKE